MKTLNRLALVSLVLLLLPRAFAQVVPGSPAHSSLSTDDEHKLTKFDLNFPGGTPRELVLAIQKAMGRPLNAVVPDQDTELKLPPLEMKRVDVQQLFAALEQASLSQIMVVSEGHNLSFNTQFGFRRVNTDPLTNDSIWFFTARLPPEDREFCRFYLLTPYIQAGLTVDDITTAIQTSWKMLGVAKLPKLSFHKETSLLMAVGTTNNLAEIDDALKALGVQLPRLIQPASSGEAHAVK